MSCGGSLPRTLSMLDDLFRLRLPRPTQLLVLTESPPLPPVNSLEWLWKFGDKLIRPGLYDPPVLDVCRCQSSLRLVLTSHWQINIRPLFQCLGVDRVIYLVIAMLCERRVIFTSAQVERLSQCVYGALALLYPFAWHVWPLPFCVLTVSNPSTYSFLLFLKLCSITPVPPCRISSVGRLLIRRAHCRQVSTRLCCPRCKRCLLKTL